MAYRSGHFSSERLLWPINQVILARSRSHIPNSSELTDDPSLPPQDPYPFSDLDIHPILFLLLLLIFLFYLIMMFLLHLIMIYHRPHYCSFTYCWSYWPFSDDYVPVIHFSWAICSYDGWHYPTVDHLWVTYYWCCCSSDWCTIDSLALGWWKWEKWDWLVNFYICHL